MLSIRLISHGPHDHAGMIFVPFDQIPQYLFVMLSYGKGFIGIAAVSGTDAYCGSLINNNDALSVAESVDFLRIRVMAGAEGVGMNPVQEVDILHIEAEIQPSSTEKRILMFAEALEVKRFPVDQKLCSLHFHGTEPKFFGIAVLPVMHFRFVQIRSIRIRLPEMNLWDPEFSFSSGGLHFTVPFRIYDFQSDGSVTIHPIRENFIV